MLSTAVLVPADDTPLPQPRATAPAIQSPAPPTLRERIDALPPEALREIAPLLREHYLAPEKIDDAELARA